MDALTSALSVPAETSPFIPTQRRSGGSHGNSAAWFILNRSRAGSIRNPENSTTHDPDAAAVGDLGREYPPAQPLVLYGMGCGILLAVGLLISMVVFLAINRDKDTVRRTLLLKRFDLIRPRESMPTQTALPQMTRATQTEIVTPPHRRPWSFLPKPLSAVAQNTPTAAPTEAPPATAKPSQKPQGDLFAMYYNDTSFYIKNLSGKDRSIYPLGFDQLDKNGNPTFQFEGWRWGNIYPKFRAGLLPGHGSPGSIRLPEPA